jgi:deazaflavin-dependent oxidoreductase (nitroreductase family)
MTDSKLSDSLPPWIKDHVRLYLGDGEAGHLWDSSIGGGKGMITTLLLTTIGRKSGNTLTLPLIYRPAENGGYCVIASKGGAPSHPAWFLNLEAKPNVYLKVANKEMSANARIAEGAERDKLWEIMVEYYPPYAVYKAATARKIPVVVFDAT